MTLAPYYSDDHVTIYHGDTLEVLDALALPAGSVDAVVTSQTFAFPVEPSIDPPGVLDLGGVA